MASKYDPLYQHLKALPSSEGEVMVTFADIEIMLGMVGLPLERVVGVGSEPCASGGLA